MILMPTAVEWALVIRATPRRIIASVRRHRDVVDNIAAKSSGTSRTPSPSGMLAGRRGHCDPYCSVERPKCPLRRLERSSPGERWMTIPEQYVEQGTGGFGLLFGVTLSCNGARR